MIPIAYTGDMTAYDDFCSTFKKHLEKIIQRGYVCNRKKISVKDARSYMRKLPKNQKALFKAAVGNRKGTWINLPDYELVEAPCEMLDDECIRTFKWFLALFDDIAVADDQYMNLLMAQVRLYMRGINNKQKVHESFYKVVVEGGYERDWFPRKELIKATDVRVCPYCNRIFVESVEVEGTQKVIKGQLDHFYPKEKYPFLALSKYNLVPSCTYCNGGSGKHNTDARIRKLVNPFFMNNPQVLSFRSDVPRKGFLSLKTMESAINLMIDTTLCADMANNVEVFNLKALYDTHRDYVSELYYKYMKMKTKAYRDFVRKMTKPSKNQNLNVVKQMSLADWDRIVLGVYSDPSEQSKRPLSKFLSDLYEDFKRKGY